MYSKTCVLPDTDQHKQSLQHHIIIMYSNTGDGEMDEYIRTLEINNTSVDTYQGHTDHAGARVVSLHGPL